MLTKPSLFARHDRNIVDPDIGRGVILEGVDSLAGGSPAAEDDRFKTVHGISSVRDCQGVSLVFLGRNGFRTISRHGLIHRANA
jgi:hypothetical protein